MKKITTKFKKIIVAFGLAIITLPSKVLASPFDDSMQVLYGPPQEEVKVSIFQNILKIAKIAIIPIVLIIGLIVFLKKSKNTKKEKIIIVFSTIIIAVILFLMINSI